MDPSHSPELHAIVRKAVDEALAEFQPTLIAAIHDAVRIAIVDNIEIIVEDSSELLDGEP
jgi:hypothetical protein